jgi:predicted ATPase
MADGITRIAVEGFKSISKKQSIEIAPLTILAGANSSGKSSIMQPLLLLKQTLEQTFDPGGLWIAGPNVKFTSSDQFFSRTVQSSSFKEGREVNARDANVTVRLLSEDLEFQVTFRRGTSFIELVEQIMTIDGERVILRPDMSNDEIRSALPRLPNGKISVLRNRFLLNAAVEGFPVTSPWVEPIIRRLIHVPGLRGNSSRTYPVTAIGPSYPGTFEYYVASVIQNWQSQDHEKYDATSRDLQELGLTQRVYAQQVNDSQIDLLVSRLIKGEPQDLVSVADVGLGVSLVLPVVVALRAADSGHMVYVEEPEIHLHPRAQVKLASILAGAAKRGVRVIAETHSTLLLTAIQTMVAKGELSPERVKLHWFQRDPESGVTTVTPASLDENGAFGDWPEDFGDVILKAESAYLDAVTERSAPN